MVFLDQVIPFLKFWCKCQWLQIWLCLLYLTTDDIQRLSARDLNAHSIQRLCGPQTEIVMEQCLHFDVCVLASHALHNKLRKSGLMAKERSEEREARRKEKKDRKEKSKESATGTNGVKKPEKERKHKETKPVDVDIATKLLNDLNSEKSELAAIKENEKPEINTKAPPLIGALVPFANPLADEKQQKKVLKGVKKCKICLRKRVVMYANF